MAEFTLLEVHLDGAEFTANAPGSGRLSRDADDGDESGLGGRRSEGEGGSSPLPVLMAVVGLVAAVILVRRILGGSGEPALDR